MFQFFFDQAKFLKGRAAKERTLKKVYKNMVQASVDNWEPKTKRDQLALMIAETFNDRDQINLYITYCKKYPLGIVYRAFSEAKNYPQERIKKSRAAIFFYLVKIYAHQTNQHSSH